MEGVRRVYDTGIILAKERYVPTNLWSFIVIVCSTTVVFLLVDHFMKFRLFRWIYWGGLGLIVFFVFVGWTDAHEITMTEKEWRASLLPSPLVNSITQVDHV